MQLLCFIPGYAQLSIALCTDSQAYIRSLAKQASRSGHYLVKTFHSEANALQNTLQINWISSHSNVQGNEKANELAKLAAQGQTSPAGSLPPLLHHPPSPVQLLKNKPIQLKSTPCGKNNGRTHHGTHKWNESTSYSLLRNSERSKIISLVPKAAFFYSYVAATSHLFRLRCINTDICQACLTQQGATSAKETVTHFLFDCWAYQYKHHDLDRALSHQNRHLEYIICNKKSIQILLKYIG